jgi:hypothetical protein
MEMSLFGLRLAAERFPITEVSVNIPIQDEDLVFFQNAPMDLACHWQYKFFYDCL